MSKCSLLTLLVVLCCATVLPEQKPNAMDHGFGFAVSCRDQVAITTVPAGVSSLSLESGRSNWATARNLIPDLGPVVAGDTVAVVSDSFNTIYAFSKQTGKLLWKKNHRSNLLVSDGKYLYVLRAAYDGITALSPSSGETVWSLVLPTQRGRPVDVGIVKGDFLYTDFAVVNLSKRAVVHSWAENIDINSIAIDETGKILVGHLSGAVTEYDESFKPLRTMRAGDGAIVQLAPAGGDTLIAIYDHRTASTHGAVKLMTQEGQLKWQIPLLSDRWLDQHPFRPFGEDVLVIEPGTAKDKLRLVSRKLATGNVKWATGDGDFVGPPVICGDAVYVRKGDQIRSLNVHTGEAGN